MPDDSLPKPHDRLFRATFSNPENAAAFLRHHLDAPLMALRLLSYMVRIWQRQAQERGPSSRLAPILPLVLAQSKDHWKTSTHIHDLFAFPPKEWHAVRAWTPDFAFRLLQLVA
jgi:hypothetical protein